MSYTDRIWAYAIARAPPSATLDLLLLHHIGLDPKCKQTPWKSECVRSLPVSASLLSCVPHHVVRWSFTLASADDSQGTDCHKYNKSLLMIVTHLTPFILCCILFINCQGILRGRPNATWAGFWVQFKHNYHHHSRAIHSRTSQITSTDLFQRSMRWGFLVLSCTSCSVWGHSAALPWESSSELKLGSQGISAKHQMVYFCSPLWCVSAWLTSSARPGSGQLTEQFRKGPSLQMVVHSVPARGSEGLAAGLEPQPLTG